MGEDGWKAYGIVLTVVVVAGILAVMGKQSDLNDRIEARESQRSDAIQALEEVRSSLRDLELKIQGKAIDVDTIDLNDEKAMDRAAEVLFAEPDPDARFDEIQSAIEELDKVLNRHKELADLDVP